ncbi:MAG: trypsin-like serine protease [Deltaproteobacteria bacterium]|nr:trypsin-like serine protease [Deltaproteobacteria bacterium]
MLITLLLSAALAFEATEALTDDLKDGGGIDVERPEAHGIINGEDATIDNYPMTGGLIFKGYIDMGSYGAGNMFTFMCSSTLIAPDVVILAAHCVDPDALTYGGMGTVSDIEYGWTRQADLTEWASDTPPSGWPADTAHAKAWVTHPSWDMNALQVGLHENFDVALVFLEEPLFDVPLGTLITEEESHQIALNNEVDVVGWGQQTATSGWDPPPAGTFALKQWGTSYIAQLDAAEYQVGRIESDVRKCHGDSGGPSFMEVDSSSRESMRLIGVTSHAYDNTDCSQTGGVDTRIDHYLDWIDAEMQARCADGTRSWCDQPGILAPPMGVSDSWAEVGTSDWEPKGGCSTLPVGAIGAWGLGLLGLIRRRRA